MPKKIVSRGRITFAKKPETKPAIKPESKAAIKQESKTAKKQESKKTINQESLITMPSLFVMPKKKAEPAVSLPKIAKPPAPAAKPIKGGGSSSGYSAKNITVLEGLEAVRKRPGMYIGSTGTTGLHHLIWEIIDNSIDEAMAGHCTQIIIELLPDHWVSVIDNGRGIPVDIHPVKKVSALELVLCTLHAGGKFGEEGSGYKVSGGLHGVGGSVVNALSTNMKAIIHRDGKIWEQEYEYGKPVTKVKPVGNSKTTGTTIMFHADGSIFETTDYEWKYIIDHVRQQAYLTKGIHIIIKDSRSDEEKTKDATALPFPATYQFYFEGGIASYTKHINKNKEIKHENVFYVDKKVDDITVEIALQYTDDYNESLFAFANNIANPDGGMHVAGFRTALTRTLNNYARNKEILKEKDANLTGDDVREGLTAIISVKIPNPQFEGQTKAKLGNPEVKPAVENIFSEHFAIYLEEHPKDAEAIIGKCIIAAKARAAAKMARDTVLRKSALEGFTLPGKLADCSSRNAEESELFIVEGDSAGGCFDGDTKIALADGRNLSFKELAAENKKGKNNYCYTIKDNGEMGIEKILHPRVTKKNAAVIKIVLDNGEELICTPDHKFMLRDDSFVEAQNLKPEMSLMPLYKKISSIEGRITIAGYEMTLNTLNNKWKFTHLLAHEYNMEHGLYEQKYGYHKYHKDFNKLNNNPCNLLTLSKEDHLQIHRDHAAKTLHRPDVIERCNTIKRIDDYRRKISETMKKLKPMLSARAKKQWQNKEYKKYMAQKFLEFYNSNEAYKEKNNKKLNEIQKQYWSINENRKTQAKKVLKFFEQHPERKNWLKETAKEQWKNTELLDWRKKETKKQWTEEFRKKRKEAYNKTYLNSSLAFAKKILEQGKNIIDNYEQEKKSRAKRDNNILSLPTLLCRFFQNNQNNFVQTVEHYNHKIKRIELLSKKIDVYDIEVPNTHNFALACGVFVHNSAKQGRDRHTQAILPLRGKVLNVERARIDKILTNNELKSLIIAMGTNIGEMFDIAKLRYHRIIIMTDADVDGSHIRTLLLTLFFRYFPDLIHQGHIYIAQPPLYSIKKGKETSWLYNEKALEEHLKKFGIKTEEMQITEEDDNSESAPLEVKEENKAKAPSFSIQRYKGLGEMNPEQLWETTMNPDNRIIRQVTIEDAEKANEIFDVLMGSEVAPRKHFIQTQAKNVKNLDI